MIAKWLNLLEGSRLSSGGGTPLGEATVWDSVADWLALGGISGPLRTGDFAPVIDLDPGSGMARYNGTDWELYQALFATKADLDLFSELVAPGATAIVGTGVQTDPVYYYDDTVPEWVRTPDGSHYIYPNELDWASLPTEDTILNDDEVGVDDLGFAGSSGTAQWHGGNEWRLIDANFTSVADALAFDALYPVHAGAVARIKTAAPFNDRSIVYLYHAGEWERSGVTTTQGYVWTLTQSEALSGADPSGIGAVQEGDFGIVSASGGPIVLRYKVVDIASGLGGGTRALWIPPQVYAGAPEIKAYLFGTEATDGALNAKGWTVARLGNGTVGTSGGYIRLFGPSGVIGSAGSIAAPAITGGNKFYLTGEFRGTASGSDPYVGIFGNVSGSVPAQYILARGVSSGFIRQLSFTNPNYVIADTLSQIQGQTPPTVGLNWPSPTPFFVQALSGSSVEDLIESRFDGKLYSSYRRNFNGADSSSSYSFLLYANGGASLTTSTLEVRNVYLVTY